MDVSDPRILPAWLPIGSKARIVNGPRGEYQDLPAVVTPTGRVISRWTPTPEERQALAAGEDIYVTLLSGGQINPFYVTVGPVNWREEQV